MPQTPCLLAAADERCALAIPRRAFRNVVGAASDYSDPARYVIAVPYPPSEEGRRGVNFGHSQRGSQSISGSYDELLRACFHIASKEASRGSRALTSIK